MSTVDGVVKVTPDGPPAVSKPAVTIARTLSDTFAGIAPSSVTPFVVAQFVGAALAGVTIRLLWPGIADVARDVVVPHEPDANLPEVKRV